MLTIDEIKTAAARITPYLNKTPLLESATLNERLSGRVLIKPECLQHTGSFKFRGALNRILQLTPGQQQAGVVAYSSGNHAQGVALAARMGGVKATIVMPADAPQMKIDNTRHYGAEVVLYDRYTQSREDIGQDIATRSGAILIPPYDDYIIMAGQGTVGLEVADECLHRGIMPDAFIVCCSGGGLAAGCAVALAAQLPGTDFYTAEPEDFDDTARSLATGTVHVNASGGRSICDALLVPMPGAKTFPILQEHADGGVGVSDKQVQAAVKFAFEEFQLVVEPGGAVALASVLFEKIQTKNRTIVVVCTGGNVDAKVFAEILNPALVV